MKKEFLEAGRILNTHGLKGEVRIEPWCDSPKWFCALRQVYLDGKPVRILSARVQGPNVIAKLEGTDDIDGAILLKNKTVYLSREDVKLPEGTFFVEDLIGLKALNDDTGEELGTVADILDLPGGRLYEIHGEREILIPDRKEFVKDLDPAQGWARFHIIEGL